MRIAIAGAGGHGRVLLDILRLNVPKGLDVVFFDDHPHGSRIEGFPMGGSIADLIRDTSFDGVMVAIGENCSRRRIQRTLVERGHSIHTLKHPQSIHSPRSTLGLGSVAIAGSVVNPEACVGDGVILNTLCSVGHGCSVGDYAQLAPGVNLGGSCTIETGAFLGIGAKVVPLIAVKEWSVVGAGAVVLEDVPPRTFVAGVPARVIRELNPEELSSRDAKIE